MSHLTAWCFFGGKSCGNPPHDLGGKNEQKTEDNNKKAKKGVENVVTRKEFIATLRHTIC